MTRWQLETRVSLVTGLNPTSPRESLITQGLDYTFISRVERESRRVIAALNPVLEEQDHYPASCDEAKSLQGQPEVYSVKTL
jgi:hypothetical protein